MDFARLASELLRALRGKRSQPAFSRQLRYKSNVAYLWEAGRAYPSFEKTLAIARAARVEPAAALRRFYGEERLPDWLRVPRIELPLLALSFLEELRGGTSVAELARRTGFNRFAIARWLDGRAAPRLPQALALIEASSLRVLDFVASLVDPKRLPSFAAAHADLVAARRAAYELPFSLVVLHALELEDYRRLQRHEPGFLARRLGLSEAEEQSYLSALLAAGQIRDNGARYEPTRIQVVDTRGDERRAAQLRRYFFQLALDRVIQGTPSASGYNVFAVSRADYARIIELQRGYYAQLRAIVAASEPVQVIALASTHVLPLSSSDASHVP
jgi:transcriptional regulator with XRE-family HTH domain